MSRRRKAERRKLIPDPVYNSELASRFINNVMWDGKKCVASTLFYKAVEKLGESVEDGNGFKVFENAIHNAKPMQEVRSRRIGGSNYQVPIRVRADRQTALAIRWLIEAARARKERNFALRLAGELRDAANGVGSTMKKRENVHKMADANKAFAHFRL
jgi:small subunit ribosomal protein S7